MAETSNGRAESFGAVAPFSVHCSHVAETHTIALCGELDLATVRTLERELDAVADARVIVLDLRELEFIDSSGLHVIVDAHRRGGAQLLVLPGPERVQRAFELCGLLALLTFVDEIPAGDADNSAISEAARATDRPMATVRAATARRAEQGALAGAVRELRSRRERRVQ